MKTNCKGELEVGARQRKMTPRHEKIQSKIQTKQKRAKTKGAKNGSGRLRVGDRQMKLEGDRWSSGDKAPKTMQATAFQRRRCMGGSHGLCLVILGK